MRKNLGPVPAVYPMPVLMVAAYDEDGTVDVLNAAWGQICQMDKIALFIGADHKTTKSILKTKAFTVSLAPKAKLKEADFFGIASGNDIDDKFERTGLEAIKSEYVNAPIITEFPVTMECELAEVVQTENMHCVVGRIVNTSACEKVMTGDKIDPAKLPAFAFDQFGAGYYDIGEKIGQAWGDGMELV